MLENTLIKNNCASQKGKGTHKAWEYFEEDLKKAYKKWGRDFYVSIRIVGVLKSLHVLISYRRDGRLCPSASLGRTFGRPSRITIK